MQINDVYTHIHWPKWQCFVFAKQYRFALTWNKWKAISISLRLTLHVLNCFEEVLSVQGLSMYDVSDCIAMHIYYRVMFDGMHCWNVFVSLDIEMAQVDENLPLQRQRSVCSTNSQYYGCWCPGDSRSRGIELVLLVYSGLSTNWFGRISRGN